jgi:peptide deformylase
VAIREIRYLPDPVLRKKAKRVPSVDGSVRRLINDMVETLRAARGVGLAAPQVGVSLRIVVIEMPEEKPFTLINPEVVHRAGEREISEGCLSIPGYAGMVKRSVSVIVKGRDEKGHPVRIKATDLLAQALEHELDHLNGKLYVDRLESPDKLYRVEPKTEEEAQAEPR